MEKKNCRGCHLEEYVETNVRKVVILTKEVYGNVGEFTMHCFSKGDTVKEDGLTSTKRKEVLIGISGPATKVWMLPSLTKMFISAD